MHRIHRTINGQPHQPARPREVISRSAILILSGVLIGTGIGHGVTVGIYAYSFLAGVAGLISFFALDRLAERRRAQNFRETLEKVTTTLDTRIRRHVGQEDLAMRKPRSRGRVDYSYVTVRHAGY